jgi:hypothetical protein
MSALAFTGARDRFDAHKKGQPGGARCPAVRTGSHLHARAHEYERVDRTMRSARVRAQNFPVLAMHGAQGAIIKLSHLV